MKTSRVDQIVHQTHVTGGDFMTENPVGFAADALKKIRDLQTGGPKDLWNIPKVTAQEYTQATLIVLLQLEKDLQEG